MLSGLRIAFQSLATRFTPSIAAAATMRSVHYRTATSRPAARSDRRSGPVSPLSTVGVRRRPPSGFRPNTGPTRWKPSATFLSAAIRKRNHELDKRIRPIDYEWIDGEEAPLYKSSDSKNAPSSLAKKDFEQMSSWHFPGILTAYRIELPPPNEALFSAPSLLDEQRQCFGEIWEVLRVYDYKIGGLPAWQAACHRASASLCGKLMPTALMKPEKATESLTKALQYVDAKFDDYFPVVDCNEGIIRAFTKEDVKSMLVKCMNDAKTSKALFGFKRWDGMMWDTYWNLGLPAWIQFRFDLITRDDPIWPPLELRKTRTFN